MKLNFIKEIDREEITTEELLMKSPSHIGRNKFNGFYISDGESIDIGWLYLHNDGKDWCAFYGDRDEIVCLNPDVENPPYNNAICYGTTPQEALQKLFDWCVENDFINLSNS